jgi:hypothetical protein
MFITLEGLDGSGKTTQFQPLVSWLASRGHAVLALRDQAAPKSASAFETCCTTIGMSIWMPGRSSCCIARPGRNLWRPASCRTSSGAASLCAIVLQIRPWPIRDMAAGLM